jgi:four helix bundle protein
MASGYKTYRQLDVWIKSRALVKEIYVITKEFPKEEMYGLSAQMRRCAISIPSNIAEGFGRQYRK